MTKKLFNLILSLFICMVLVAGSLAQGGKPPEKPKEKDREVIKEKPKPTPTPRRPN